MAEESGEDLDWPRNYFNYFTEIEEHFQRARGTALFLLSPLDWALIENWKNAGIPIAAVLRGIDEAFEKWRSRKTKRRAVNSLAYCAQAVLEAAQRISEGTNAGTKKAGQAPFTANELETYLSGCSARLRARPEAVFGQLAGSVEALALRAEECMSDLEDLERRLTTLEDKMVSAVRAQQSDEELYSIRQALDADLKPYRGKMSADQLALLEKRYLDTALLERTNLPRLSLFYLH